MKICTKQKLWTVASKHSKSQQVFIQGENEFPCASGNIRIPNRPRPSSIAEGNLEPEDDVEIQEGDKKGSKT